jgi:hypothetical protein
MPDFHAKRLAYRVVLFLAMGLSSGMAWAQQAPDT